MKTIKNIASFVYFFSLIFSFVLGSMMHYFGNSNGKYILVISAIVATYEIYRSDKK